MKMYGMLTVSSGAILFSLALGTQSLGGMIFAGLGILWAMWSLISGDSND